jgi:hypothetical protein
MPGLPRPARLSLHDAIEYVAGRCKCDAVKAGKAVLSALGEGAIVAYADVLVPDRTYLPGFYPPVVGPPRRVSAGVESVPSELWASYPWLWFERRAVFPRGNLMFRHHTADGRNIGPVFVRPTIATADINRWLGGAGDQSLLRGASRRRDNHRPRRGPRQGTTGFGAAAPTRATTSKHPLWQTADGRSQQARGRKPGSGAIDDDTRLLEMLHLLAEDVSPSIFGAAGKVVEENYAGASRDSARRRLARKFGGRFGKEPPAGQTWKEVEHN